MAETSAIEWTEATWNPWYGCQKVSPGCKLCYMYRDMERYGRDPRAVTRSKTAFKMPLKLKEPTTIFTCSWSDWFIEEADGWRPEAWEIIKATPQHTYQILTKRPERILDHLPPDWGNGYPNVWLGVSVESQEWADKRIPHLLRVPAAVRFLSCEPLLGPVDLTNICAEGTADSGWFVNALSLEEWTEAEARAEFGNNFTGTVDWVIVGGESGHQHRPMELDWARQIRDACNTYGVAFFLKQLGGTPANKKGGDEALLDGRRWTEMPKPRPPHREEEQAG